MAICDVCSTPIGPEAKRYSASQIKTAVRAGFRPPETAFELGAAFGMSQAQTEASWVQRVMADTTDWLLCPSCASKAGRHLGQSQARRQPPRIEKVVKAPPTTPPIPAGGGPRRMDFIAPKGKLSLAGNSLTFRRGRFSSETESISLDSLRSAYLFFPTEFKWRPLRESQYRYQYQNLDALSEDAFSELHTALSEQYRFIIGDFTLVLADFEGRTVMVSWKKLASSNIDLMTALRRHQEARREELSRWLEGNPSITIGAKKGSLRADVSINAAGIAQGSSKFIPWSDLAKIEMSQVQSLVDICYFRFIPAKASRLKKIVTGVDPKQTQVCLAELDFWQTRDGTSLPEGETARQPAPPAAPAHAGSAGTSILAVVSLVAGLVGLFLPVLGALAAIVTGHLAYRDIRRSEGQQKGKGMATLGLVLGYGQLALIVLIGALLLFSPGRDRTTSTRPTATLAARERIVTATPAAKRATATLDVRPLTATAEAVQQATATARAAQARQATFQAVHARATAAAQAVQATATAQAVPSAVDASSRWPLVLLDTFDTNVNNWPMGSASTETAIMTETFVNGKYRWDMQALQGFHSGAHLKNVSVSDFYLVVETQKINGSNDSHCGVEFRIADTNNKYYFGIYKDQYFTFFLLREGQWTVLIGLTPTTALRTGEVNRIAVIAEGSHFGFFINDQFVAEVDNDQLDSGSVGLAIELSQAGAKAVFEFDNFELHAPSSPTPAEATPTPVPPPPTPTGEAAATPAAQSELVISPDNVEQVKQLAIWNEYTVNQVAWSPDGKLLAVASYNLYILDAQTLQQVAVIDAGGWIESVVFSPDGTMLASTSLADGGVKLWEVSSGSELRAFSGFELASDVDFSPDGTKLAVSVMMMTAKILDVSSGSELLTLPGHYAVFAVAFSPDGQTVATADIGESILWDVATGRELRSLSSHDFSQVNSLAFSPDGQTLASGYIDGTIKLWDVASGRELHTLAGHTNQVESVAFSPDGSLLASASWDLTVRLWDVASGAELLTLTGHSEWVQSVAFSPDGATLASGANDGTLRLWGVSP